MKSRFFNRDFFYLSFMEFSVEKIENYTLVKILITRLSALIAPKLKAELVVLSSTGNSNILLDISACEYCDDSGLSAILTANRLCKNSKGVFVLTGINSNVDEFINLTQLDKEINIAYNIKIADQVIKKMIEEKEQ